MIDKKALSQDAGAPKLLVVHIYVLIEIQPSKAFGPPSSTWTMPILTVHLFIQPFHHVITISFELPLRMVAPNLLCLPLT